MTMVADISERELVGKSVAGDRHAFGVIVGRYQRLICGIAYSATGSLSQSEDLAQEIFVTAWKHLGELREVEKLRGWLCGIARNVVNSYLRGRKTEPATGSLEGAMELPAADASPAEGAIKREEETLLWRALEGIPEIYREPLVLFYRQGQSVEGVADALELSEDAVKQRLARGRKILHEEMVGMVEDTLRRSNPGAAFTTGVLTALPGLTISAKAAMIGATAAKGSAGAKAAGMLGVFGALLSPLLMVVGYWAGYKMSRDGANSDDEKRFVKQFYLRLVSCILAFILAYTLLTIFGRSLLKNSPPLFVGLTLGLAIAYTTAIAGLVLWALRKRKEVLKREANSGLHATPVGFEYCSKTKLFGWPLVHIRMVKGIGRRTTVKAWIAVGESAIGLLFAFGGNAVGLVSIGGCAVGGIAFGGCSLGLLSLGGFAIGAWALGGLSIGWQAFGGCAIAWDAAMGGIAIAKHIAGGFLAYAEEANNAAVGNYLENGWFFRAAQHTSHFGALMNMIWVLPLVVWQSVVRRAKPLPISK